MEYYSQNKQDLIILEYLNNKTNVDFYQLLINIGIPDYNIKHFNPQL